VHRIWRRCTLGFPALLVILLLVLLLVLILILLLVLT
jgi:hypothetical protein